LAMGGRTVQAYPNTMMMVHNSWVFTAGNKEELIETANILGDVDENIVSAFTGKTKMGKREVRDILKGPKGNGTYMNAKTMKEKGFIDTILEGGKAVKAQFDLSMFANAPDDILSVQDSGRELTRKETERALRNAGASRDYARAMAAKGAGASDIDVEMIEDLLKLKMLIGGK